MTFPSSIALPCTALVTLVDLAIYFIFMLKVGIARRHHGVAAPAIDGPEAFQRVFRVQANTLEQLILHLPLLWLMAFTWGDAYAAALGAVWAFGRVLYARGYYRKAKRRTKGFIIGMTVNALLFAGALAGVLASF